MADFPYTRFDDISPIPALSIYLQNPKNSLLSASFDFAILDTGSDITIFPYSIISKLQVRLTDAVKAVTFRGLGQKTEGTPFRVRLSFDREHYINTRVIAVPDDILGNEIIIGRNILNRYVVTFNGPKLVFSISNGTI
jgi:hypothetical protein